METKQLTTEELEQIKSMQKEYNSIAFELGNTEIQLNDLENYKKSLLHSINEITKKEKSLVTILQEKYGTGNIDMETGIITPINS